MTFKRILLIITTFCVTPDSYCQYKYTDSLINLIKHTKSDTVKIDALYNLSLEYQLYKPDSALLIAQQLLDFASEKGDFYGVSAALDGIAGAYLRIGDNSKALAYQLKRLKIEEKRNRADNIAIINMSIANIHNRNKDTTKAIRYILRADSIINTHNYNDLKPYAYLNTGNIFEKANRLSEAIQYTNEALQLAVIEKNFLLVGTALNNLGNIYLRLKNYDAAISNYLKSKIYIVAENDNQTLTEGYLGLARAYLMINKEDSALSFAKQAYTIAYQGGLLNNALASSKFLADYYKKEERYDSAFVYQTTMIMLNDSIHSIEKIKQMESMSIQEQIRQQQLLVVQLKEKEEARQRLQLLAIGVIIPILFFFSIFISRRKVHRKLIQFCGILSLLLFFEYITLFLHPFVVKITDHSPALEIIIFVCIAALIVPAHHRIEHWFTKKLTTNYDMALSKNVGNKKEKKEEVIEKDMENIKTKAPVSSQSKETNNKKDFSDKKGSS